MINTCVSYLQLSINCTAHLQLILPDNLALSVIFLIKEEVRKSPTKTVSITLRKTQPRHMAPRFPLMFRSPRSQPGCPRLAEANAGVPVHLQELNDRARNYVEAASSVNTRTDRKHITAKCRRKNL